MSRQPWSAPCARMLLPSALTLAGFTHVGQSLAQSKAPKFEVASVRAISSDGPQRPPRIDQQSFTLASTAYVFIADAFGARPCVRKETSRCALISGEPAWAKKDRFEIQAKLPENSPAFTRFEFSDGEAPQIDQMLQGLLEDRFQLRVHRETREVPVYILTAAKKGPKLKPVDAAETRKIADGTSFKIQGLDEVENLKSQSGSLISRFGFRYSSMQGFADILTSFLDRPVLDRTGLGGKFDFTLEYENEPDAPTTTDTSAWGRMINAGPALFTALQEQLGLNLEPTMGRVDVLVIDHMEKPSDN